MIPSAQPARPNTFLGMMLPNRRPRACELLPKPRAPSLQAALANLLPNRRAPSLQALYLQEPESTGEVPEAKKPMPAPERSMHRHFWLSQLGFGAIPVLSRPFLVLTPESFIPSLASWTVPRSGAAMGTPGRAFGAGKAASAKEGTPLPHRILTGSRVRGL